MLTYVNWMLGKPDIRTEILVYMFSRIIIFLRLLILNFSESQLRNIWHEHSVWDWPYFKHLLKGNLQGNVFRNSHMSVWVSEEFSLGKCGLRDDYISRNTQRPNALKLQQCCLVQKQFVKVSSIDSKALTRFLEKSPLIWISYWNTKIQYIFT